MFLQQVSHKPNSQLHSDPHWVLSLSYSLHLVQFYLIKAIAGFQGACNQDYYAIIVDEVHY